MVPIERPIRPPRPFVLKPMRLPTHSGRAFLAHSRRPPFPGTACPREACSGRQDERARHRRGLDQCGGFVRKYESGFS